MNPDLNSIDTDTGTIEDSKPELTLPDWISPDPLAEVKGNLLYVEEWSKNRKFKDPASIVMAVLVLILAIACILIPIFFRESRKLPIGILGIVLGWAGFFVLRLSLRMMPLTIYENGITRTHTALENAWRREEMFIPWTKVETIELTEMNLQTGKSIILVFKLRREGKEFMDLRKVKDGPALIELMRMYGENKLVDNFESMAEKIK